MLSQNNTIIFDLLINIRESDLKVKLDKEAEAMTCGHELNITSFQGHKLHIYPDLCSSYSVATINSNSNLDFYST